MNTINRYSKLCLAMGIIIAILSSTILWGMVEYIPLQKAEVRDVTLTEVSDHLSQMESLRRAGGPDAKREYGEEQKALSNLLKKDMGAWAPRSVHTVYVPAQRAEARNTALTETSREPEGYPSGVDDRVAPRDVY